MSKERYKTKSAVFLLLKNGNKILLQKRINTGFMDGYYDLAVSGHIEEGETITQAMIRESKEECNLTIEADELSMFTVIHNRYNVDDVYYYFYFVAEITDNRLQEIRIGEKDKIGELLWAEISNLPANLIYHDKVAIKNYRNKVLLSELGFN